MGNPTETHLFALDTSVAVPLLSQSHTAHDSILAWAEHKTLALSSHAATETYSVLTRLPKDARLSPEDAVLLINDNFKTILVVPQQISEHAHEICAERGIAGGAVYDALVALAAKKNNTVLVTRDVRTIPTYQMIGARVEVLYT